MSYSKLYGKICVKNWINLRRYYATNSIVNLYTQRTHTCGELRRENIGEVANIYGWLAYKRMNRFLVIKDSYGQVQARIPDEKLKKYEEFISNLTYDTVLRLKGRVLDRGPNNTNKKLPTGEIEIEIDDIESINVCPANNPLSLEHGNESTEQTHFKYRYLALRSTRLQRNLRLRSKINNRFRRFLEEECGFVEVETPTLCNWTPGGATEFVVPASKPNLGQFYNLPQSPQLYKQLLMCGGIDRYFQIARCYRDEGSKSDRQPEFTQLDLELSFTTQKDILTLIENLIVKCWPQELEKYKPKMPFLRMSYESAMKKYGTDKPDLRSTNKKSGEKSNLEFKFLWIVDFPLFTINKETESIESSHHPFTAPIEQDLQKLKENTDLMNIKAQHYDLVLNGVELGGGSIRIHNSDLQKFVIKDILKLPIDPLENFLEALSYGAPPHGGFALGLDRFVYLLAKAVENLPENLSDSEVLSTNSIRDVIAFPKSKAGRCLMMGSPAELPDFYLAKFKK